MNLVQRRLLRKTEASRAGGIQSPQKIVIIDDGRNISLTGNLPARNQLLTLLIEGADFKKIFAGKPGGMSLNGGKTDSRKKQAQE